MFNKNLTFVPNSEDMQLLYFLAEYGYLYLKNLDNIYPTADRLDILENQNLICRNEQLICLGDEGIKLCGGRGRSNYIYYGGNIRQTILSKIASEFVREGLSFSEHNVSDYTFMPKKRLKGVHNSSILGLVCGSENGAAVFRYDKKMPIRKQWEAAHLYKLGITTMILLTKNYSREMEIETDLGITKIYLIPRNSKGYAKIKSIISHIQREDGLKQYIIRSLNPFPIC